MQITILITLAHAVDRSGVHGSLDDGKTTLAGVCAILDRTDSRPADQIVKRPEPY